MITVTAKVSATGTTSSLALTSALARAAEALDLTTDELTGSVTVNAEVTAKDDEWQATVTAVNHRYPNRRPGLGQ